MAERQARVGVKLTVDDKASKTAERIKKSFHGMKDKIKEAGSSLRAFSAQALAMTVGLELDRGIRGIISFAGEVIGAGAAAEQADRHLGGMLATASGANMALALRAGRHLRSELEEVGIAAGVSASQTISAFEQMFGPIQKAGGGIDDAMRMTETVANLSSALGVDMQRSALSIVGMQSGLVEMRDPLVQLLQNFAGMNLMADSFRKATGPERLRQLQEGFARISDVANDVPLGFNQLVQSLRDLKENVFEAFGPPVINVMNRIMTRLKTYFQDHAEDIYFTAHKWGEALSRFIETGAQKAKEVFFWIRAHWSEIVTWAKRLPAIALGGMAARSAGGAAFGVASQFLPALLMRGGGGGAAANSIEEIAKRTMASGRGGMVGAFGQALPAGLRAAPALEVGAGGAAGAASSVPAIAAAGAAFVALAAVLATAGLAVRAFRMNIAGLGTQFNTTMGSLWNSLRKLWEVLTPVIDKLAELAGYLVLGLATAIDQVVRAITWVGQAMMRDPVIGWALRQLGVDVAGSAARGRAESAAEAETARMAAVKEREEYLKQTRLDRMAAETIDSMLGNRRGAPTIDARGSHFEIHQDFRDEDPDRIAVIFARDIARSAEARVTARTSLPFGP